MEDDDLNMQNSGYYEQFFKSNLGLQLMSTVVEPLKNVKHGHDHDQSNEKTTFFNANGYYQAALMMMMRGNNSNNVGLQSELFTMEQMNYLRDSWINQQKDNNPNFNVLPPELSLVAQYHLYHHHQMQILQQPDIIPNQNSSPPPSTPSVGMEIGGSNINNNNLKALKPKKSKKSPKENGNSSVKRAKPAIKKSMDMIINGMNIDISAIPIPVCSCTGDPQQCYRWGCGGWQSACCTTTISIHPLPMSTRKRGARIAGRKMSRGAFKKVLQKLALEGYNFGDAIDLRNHWAKHGTNKFVTIR